MWAALEVFQPRIILIFLCLALYVPGIGTLPPTDRDESRFAQATSQMLETGDFVQIRFQDEARNKKPIAIHWLQAAAVSLSGTLDARRIWPYRIPSVLGAIAAVLLVYALGRRLFDEGTALLGAAFCASSTMLVAEAHLATTDAVLLATVVSAQAALSRFYIRDDSGSPPGRGAFFAFWVAQAAGILVKGPITPLVSLLTVCALSAVDRDLKWLKGLRPLRGIAIVSVLAAPWMVAIYFATDGAFFRQAVGGDLLSKVASGQESHGFAPGWYLLLMPLTLWPASFFIAPALVRAWRSRSCRAVKFCLAWAVPAWVLFELFPTKLPHYLLPVYPALCLLAAETVTACTVGRAVELHSKWMRGAVAPWSAAVFAVVCGMCALPYFTEGRFDLICLIPLAAVTACTPVFIRDFFRGRFVRAAVVPIIGTVLVIAPILQWVLPNMNSVWLSRAVAAESMRHARENGSGVAIAAAGYHEPSLVFLLGTRTRLTSSSLAARFLLDNPSGLALIGGAEEGEFRREAERLDLPLAAVAEVCGFNYSNGRKMVLRLYGTSSDRIAAKTGTEAAR